MMEFFLNEIKKIENSKQVSFTARYPFLLPLVLESKRVVRTLSYNLGPQYKTEINSNTHTWFHITNHSSPLYRKYNKKELDDGKITNIEIANTFLNDIVIPPGKIFSLWRHVGRISSRRGFRNGLVLSNGYLKSDIGGGLCQLSNLIGYMFACSECAFTERKHHSRDVFPDSNRTIPFASGATIFFNLIDLKIKNTYHYPLKLNLRTTNTQLRGSISIPVQLRYYVKLEEKNSFFFKSQKTNKVYRCNTLHRIFYDKKTKNKIKEQILWRNVAEVMYPEHNIKQHIVLIKT